MRGMLLLGLLLALSATQPDSSCPCLNGGRCLPVTLQRCRCPAGFLGSKCEVGAAAVGVEAVEAALSESYSFFYFSPEEANYYRLTFTLCLRTNPTRAATLFYVQTERPDSSLRDTPSLFETAQMVVEEGGCASFSTHYISVKRRDDDSFRRIVVGLRAQEQPGQLREEGGKQQNKGVEGGSKGAVQAGTLRVSTEVYLQASNFSTFLIIFTAFVLLVLFASFVTYLRRRYALDGLEVELEALHAQTDLARLRRSLQTLNPEDPRPRTKNSLHNLEIFMPVTHYGTMQSVFVPHLLAHTRQEEKEEEGCAICLVEFETGDEVRTTPCNHLYHRECIDNWCETRLSCPICRRGLDFTREVRQLYYELLRSELAV